MAVFLLLLPGTRYTHLHGSHIDKAIAALGRTSTATRTIRIRNKTLLRHADLLRQLQADAARADNSDNEGGQ
jgi:hypothetical protein